MPPVYSLLLVNDLMYTFAACVVESLPNGSERAEREESYRLPRLAKGGKIKRHVYALQKNRLSGGSRLIDRLRASAPERT